MVVPISLTELHPFPNHPFKVRDDKVMKETTESVKEYGVLTPAIVRPREKGGYEIVAGHRRKRACELAGLTALPALECDVRHQLFPASQLGIGGNNALAGGQYKDLIFSSLFFRSCTSRPW